MKERHLCHIESYLSMAPRSRRQLLRRKFCLWLTWKDLCRRMDRHMDQLMDQLMVLRRLRLKEQHHWLVLGEQNPLVLKQKKKMVLCSKLLCQFTCSYDVTKMLPFSLESFIALF